MKTFQDVVNTYPTLCKTGINYIRRIGMSGDEFDALLAKDRIELLNNQVHVLKVVDWIDHNIQPIKTINTKAYSYGLKHLVEKEIGYTSNGEFIAAALMLEFTMKQENSNAYFAMSTTSIKNARRRIDKLPKHPNHWE